MPFSFPTCQDYSKSTPALCSTPMPFSSPTLPESLVEYQKYLQEDYYTDPYPLYSSLVYSDYRPEYPINLVLVHRDKNENDSVPIQQQKLLFLGNVDKLREKDISIKMEEIGSLDGGKTAAHFVLIEGDPGIGKSTLCWQLCRLWRAKGNKLQHEWDLMVIIELRDEDARKASNLYELLYHPDDNTRQAIARDIEKREGKGLLLFFDGYDELSGSQHNEFLVIHKILKNKLLSKATVVVTSRPTATVKLPTQFKQRLQQYIKIAGFTETDILSYITSACGKNMLLLADLRSYVFNNSFILSVMYNPLHCTIVTEVYIDCWQNGRKGFAPNTLTELYISLVYNLLRHNLPENQSDVQKFSDLPKVMKNQLMILAEFAANGLNESQYVFTDAPDVKLGLMVPIRKLNKLQEGKATSYMFLHLTLQEYLAAFYWSNHPDQQPSDLLKPNVITSIYQDSKNRDGNARWPLLLFMAGLTKLMSFPIELMKPSSNQLDVFMICQLLFEAQAPWLVSAVFANSTTSLNGDEFYFITSSMQYSALSYCIVNSGNTSTWQLNIDHLNLQKLSDNLHYMHSATNWDERNGPAIELTEYYYFGPACTDDEVLAVNAVLHNLFPFTKSISKFHHSGSVCFFESFLNLMNFVADHSYFPRLKVLYLPRLDMLLSDPNLLNRLQLPQKLVALRIFYPSFDVLLYNLTKYPNLDELHIYADL